MRRVIWIMAMIIWCRLGMCQELADWEQFILKEVDGLNESLHNDFYVIEGSRKIILENNPSIQFHRSLDSKHHIVSGITSKHFRLWKAHSAWKLDLNKDLGTHRFYLLVSSNFDSSALKGFSKVRSLNHNIWYIEGSLRKVKKELLPLSSVLHITNSIYKPVVDSRVIDLNLNPNRVNKVHHLRPSLDGSTETISIQENRFDELDIDLINRSVPSGLESDQTDNHATEMATIIAGKGNSFITGRGVANRLTISSSDFFDAMPDADTSYESLNISTQNHSYGIERESEYGLGARAFDESANNNRNLLHVFSSGNEGLEISANGRYEGIEGFANLTGNIKMAKNTLVVGSVDTVGNVPSFVSRGPAYDGRVKPEIVAYSVVGSSNSAALVSGVASLMQQHYRSVYLEDMPSALVKALLINGTDDVGPDGLDFLTGYGNVNAWRSLRMLENNQFFSGSVADGASESFMLNIPAEAVNLTITLVWTDPPANVGDFSALINNLDLKLVNGMDETLPWVLNSDPGVESLSQPAVRSVDNLNNVEQVTIANPADSYSIEVTGSQVSGTQEFYLAWHYEMMDSFEWDFPTGSDNMPYNGETGSYFRWSTTKIGLAELSYTVDGVNWIDLDLVDLETEYWRWNDPPILNDSVKARITTSEETFETDYFTVSQSLNASVGFNCGDSLMLRWANVPEAQDYTVSVLGNENLEEVATVSDTFLIVIKSDFNDRRFSIQPNISTQKKLLPAPTFDYALQGVECYVFSFFQTVALDTGIYLNMSLGTTYGIDEVVFERNELSNGYIEINTLSNIDTDEITILDANPNQGYNEHRAIIRFDNGEQLTLSAGTSFYLTELPLRIFPNPIQSGEPFSVITRDFNESMPLLELFDDKGSLVYRQKVQGTQDIIPTVGLKSGIYVYRVTADGQDYTGRVLVR